MEEWHYNRKLLRNTAKVIMSIKSPVISKIHNQTKASFGISIQGKKEWVYPMSSVQCPFDVFSATTDKEQRSLEYLLLNGTIKVELLMLRDGGEYVSCGMYSIIKNGVQKPVEKVIQVKKAEEKTILNGSLGIRVVDEGKKEDTPFTGRVVEEETKEATYDPFTGKMNVPEQEAPAEEPAKEEAPVEEAKEEAPVEAKKTSKKRTKKADAE